MSYDQTLVMFSGGKDSFLAACLEIESGRNVILLSFDNGAEVGHENLKYSAQRIIRKYGPDRVSYAGVYGVLTMVRVLRQTWMSRSYADLGAAYPSMTNCQFQCLHCQTAMWVAALAYARARTIPRIACGYKSTDEFCTGVPEYLGKIKTLAENPPNLIKITTPVHDVEDDYVRDIMLGDRGFEPVACEPKCLLGCPPGPSQPSNWASDMMKYFDDELASQLQPNIDRLSGMFRYIKLTDWPFEGWAEPPVFADD